jgi:hypothetical protein
MYPLPTSSQINIKHSSRFSAVVAAAARAFEIRALCPVTNQEGVADYIAHYMMFNLSDSCLHRFRRLHQKKVKPAASGPAVHGRLLIIL